MDVCRGETLDVSVEGARGSRAKKSFMDVEEKKSVGVIEEDGEGWARRTLMVWPCGRP